MSREAVGWGEGGQGEQLVWGGKGHKSQFRISVKEEPQGHTRTLHLTWKVEKGGRTIFITLCELTPAKKVEWAESKGNKMTIVMIHLKNRKRRDGKC